MSIVARWKYLAERICFWASYPFVILAFKRRERRRFNKAYPIRWLTSYQLLAEDLNYYEPEATGQSIDKSFADETSSNLNDIRSSANKYFTISLAIFAFLAAKSLSVDLDIDVMGIKVKEFKGVSEILFIIGTFLSLRSGMLIAKAKTFENYLHYFINSKVEPTLRQYFTIKYIPWYYFGIYFPVNQPHITPNKFNSSVSKYVSIAMLISLISFLFIYIGIAFIAFYHVVIAATLGKYTYLLMGFCAAVYLVLYVYLFIVFSKFPYRDYINSHRLELLEQVNPSALDLFRKELYLEGIQDRIDLEKRGYL